MKWVTWIDQKQNRKVGIRVLPAGKSDDSDRNQSSSQAHILDFASSLGSLEERGIPHPSPGILKPIQMTSILQSPDLAIELAQIIEAQWREGNSDAASDQLESKLELGAPLPEPKSIRDGYAFRQHVETMRKSRNLPMIEEFDLYPTFYFSNHLAVSGPGPVICPKRLAEKGLDYELELAVVLGKQIRNASLTEAEEAIFGFMIFNDWSDRSIWLKHESKMSLGPAKSKDFASSLGPYLVTRDELEPYREPSDRGSRWNLKMSVKLNGEALSEGNANTMHWTFAEIIAHASDGVTLYPGEVIGSGTVGTGCLAELNLTQKTNGLWLKDGDEVVCEIAHLGQLKNTIQIEG
jgi:fumarylacetoacetate (FAA) hydrolase